MLLYFSLPVGNAHPADDEFAVGMENGIQLLHSRTLSSGISSSTAISSALAS